MATLTPTLTLASSDAFAGQPLNLTVTDSLTIAAPMSDISRMNTDDDIGHGAGVIIDDEDTNEYFVYIKHTGILSSDGKTGASSSDFICCSAYLPAAILACLASSLAYSDADSQIIKLYPGEFCWMTTTPADGTDGGVEVGGIAVAAGSAAVQVNYGYWKRS